MLGGPKQEIYRKAALERLASPERLDEMMRVTQRRGWIALLTCATLLVAALVWGIFGSIPQRVTGRGILLHGGSLSSISANTTGIITNFLVKPGDPVIADETVIAHVSQGDADITLQKLASEVAKLEAKKTVEEELARQSETKEKSSLNDQKRQLGADLGAAEAARTQAKKDFDVAKRLLARGAGSGSRVDETRLALTQAETRVKQVNSEFSDIAAKLQRVENESASSVRELALQIDMKRLEIKAQEDMRRSAAVIYATVNGIVHDIIVPPNSSVNPQTTLMRIERSDEGLKAIIYVPNRKGQLVRQAEPETESQEVQLSPDTVKKEKSGSIRGIVEAKQDQPVTRQSMMNDLGNNEKLVEEYAGGSSPIRLLVHLSEREDSAQLRADGFSGYDWTSGKGPPTPIFSGTPVTASVVVAHKRPIEYVADFFTGMKGSD